mgnify:CR=1 FL=1
MVNNTPSEVIVVPQYDNKGILTSYLCYYGKKVILLDLACLLSYPNPTILPSMCSWEGFPEEEKFRVYVKSVNIDMTIQDVKNVVFPYFLKDFKMIGQYEIWLVIRNCPLEQSHEWKTPVLIIQH